MIVFHSKYNCAQLCYHIVFFAAGYYYKQLNTNVLISNVGICIMGGGIWNYHTLLGYKWESVVL